MDNKRVYKRISTCFWFMLATLPLLIVLFRFILMWFVHTDSISNITDINSYVSSIDFEAISNTIKISFRSAIPNFLRNLFDSLFSQLGLNIGASIPSFMSFFLAWFVWVYFMELMVDFIIWLPKWFHSILEKGFDKLS